MEALRKEEREKRAERGGREKRPIREVGVGGGEGADELLEFAEGGVAGEVAGVRIGAAAGELGLVAVEHRTFVPSRHCFSLSLSSFLICEYVMESMGMKERRRRPYGGNGIWREKCWFLAGKGGEWGGPITTIYGLGLKVLEVFLLWDFPPNYC